MLLGFEARDRLLVNVFHHRWRRVLRLNQPGTLQFLAQRFGRDDGLAGQQVAVPRVVVLKDGGAVSVRVEAALFQGLDEVPARDAELVYALLLQDVQVVVHQPHEDALGVDLGELEVAVAVALGQQPLLKKLGQVVEQILVAGVPQLEGGVVARALGQAVQIFELLFYGGEGRVKVAVPRAVVLGDDGVQLHDEHLHLVDELEHPFRDHDHAVVLARRRALDDPVADHAREVPQGHPVGGVVGRVVAPGLFHPVFVHEINQVLADDRDVGVGLKRDLEREVARHPTHDLADVVVLDVRARVVAEPGDGVGEGARGRVEPEGDRAEHVPVVVAHLDIAVDRLGHPDHLDPVAEHRLGQEGRVGVGVVPAHDHERVQPEVLAGPARHVHLLVGVDLGATRLEHRESAEVAVGVDPLPGDLDPLVFDHPVGADQEPEQTVVRVGTLGGVEQAGNHVVSTGGRAAGKHDADVPPAGASLRYLPGRLTTHHLDPVADDVGQQALGLLVDGEAVPIGLLKCGAAVVENRARRRAVGSTSVQLDTAIVDGALENGVTQQVAEIGSDRFCHDRPPLGSSDESKAHRLRP